MRLSKYTFRVLALFLCFGLATSCVKREDSETAITTDSNISTSGPDQHMGMDSANLAPSSTMAGGMDMATMDDGNILAWMVMADSMEVAMGNMAKTKAQHAEVRKFAQTMATEHAKMQQEAQGLAAKQNITPVMPSKQMMTYEMMTQHSTLQSASGRTFDSLYMGSQVAMHQHVLDNLNLAKPQNAEMRSLLEKAKTHIQKHLDDAKNVQGKLLGAR